MEVVLAFVLGEILLKSVQSKASDSRAGVVEEWEVMIADFDNDFMSGIIMGYHIQERSVNFGKYIY